MIVKNFLEHTFESVNDSFRVRYWDGENRVYGDKDPEFTLRFHSPPSTLQLLLDPMLELGECYMNRDIEVEGSLYDALRAFVKHQEELQAPGWIYGLRRLGRSGLSIAEQKQDVREHYDLGNDFYRLWLDDTMTYSCGYFQSESDSLEDAQRQKIHHSLRKLRPGGGDRLLDIGSGWGSVILEAADRYNVEAEGITLSKEQAEISRRKIRERGLSDRVSVRLKDYRELAREGEQYDKIVSIGMAEHVGKENLPVFYRAVKDLLKPGGFALVHHISTRKEGAANRWIRKYIFPGGYIPALPESIECASEAGMDVVDVENIGRHYALTLDRWKQRFDEHSETVRDMFDDRFVRMWRLYLGGCAEQFRWNRTTVHQMLLAREPLSKVPMTRDDLYRNRPPARDPVKDITTGTEDSEPRREPDTVT